MLRHRRPRLRLYCQIWNAPRPTPASAANSRRRLVTRSKRAEPARPEPPVPRMRGRDAQRAKGAAVGGFIAVDPSGGHQAANMQVTHDLRSQTARAHDAASEIGTAAGNQRLPNLSNTTIRHPTSEQDDRALALDSARDGKGPVDVSSRTPGPPLRPATCSRGFRKSGMRSTPSLTRSGSAWRGCLRVAAAAAPLASQLCRRARRAVRPLTFFLAAPVAVGSAAPLALHFTLNLTPSLPRRAGSFNQ